MSCIKSDMSLKLKPVQKSAKHVFNSLSLTDQGWACEGFVAFINFLNSGLFNHDGNRIYRLKALKLTVLSAKAIALVTIVPYFVTRGWQNKRGGISASLHFGNP